MSFLTTSISGSPRIPSTYNFYFPLFRNLDSESDQDQRYSDLVERGLEEEIDGVDDNSDEENITDLSEDIDDVDEENITDRSFVRRFGLSTEDIDDVDDDSDEENMTFSTADLPPGQRENWELLFQIKQLQYEQQVRGTILHLARQVKETWEREAEDAKREREERNALLGDGEGDQDGGFKELPTWAKAGNALFPFPGYLDDEAEWYPPAVYQAILNGEV